MHSIRGLAMRRGTVVIGAFLALTLLPITSAFAGAGGSASPTFPSVVNVGEAVAASFTIVNKSDGSNASDVITLSNIILTPACKSSPGGTCDPGSQDPGVFQVLSSPVPTGASGTSCDGITFTPTISNPGTGAVTFVPSATVQLGPTDQSIPLPTTCVINFQVEALKLPTQTSSGPGTTLQLGRVTGTTPGGAGFSASGQDETTITAPSLAIAKTPDDGQIIAGQAATFTITVTNPGTGAAHGVTISDNLPGNGGVTWGLSSGSGCAVTGPVGTQVLNCTLPDPFAASATFTAVITAATSMSVCATWINSATVAGTNNVSIPPVSVPPDQGKITCTVPTADLAITKDDGKTVVNANGSTTYTVVVTNAGPFAVVNSIMKDVVASGLTKTGTPTCGNALNGAVCPTVGTGAGQLSNANLEGDGVFIPNLPVNGSLTFTITVHVDATSGSVTNGVFVVPPSGTVDPNLNNNVAYDTDQVQPIADLAITKDDGKTIVNANGSTTYTVVVTNAGPSSADNSIMKDVVASGLTKTGTPTCGNALNGAVCPTVGTGAGQLSNANLEGNGVFIPTLPVNGSLTFTITVHVDATSGSVTNTVFVVPPSGTTDPNLNNNVASDTDQVQPIADLAITKDDGVTVVNAGGSTTYTVVVTNAGPSSADNSIMKDVVASGLTKTGTPTCGNALNGAVCPTVGTGAGQLSNANLEGNGVFIPTLPVNGSLTFTITVHVDATSGSVTNGVFVVPPSGITDPNLNNNVAYDTDQVQPIADLAITKDDGKTVVNRG